ncbi:hypothetical protein AL492_17705 [Elizabethkingia anophelis]|uniref:hypothetical protein n=1 Tax=Elizabethkingia anophelis TaxID=1117645 RepID=UPI000CE97938|nr:hypothetical protein [Elizabethkingia anophelis]AVF49359.1 hypothetical protein AL491_15300 [Elizabethkingia anophelis]AVF53354.1 hypothetical protein AL492_17705 [Elizabethkingia anophelis]
MWYKVDFRKLGALNLPINWRTPSVIAVVNVLNAHLDTVNDEFNENRNYNIERATHNSQLCHLRGLLNDKFDSDRRIAIEDPINKQKTYIYPKASRKPKYIGKLKIYPKSEFVEGQVDFIVKVPKSLLDYYDQIYNTVDYYRLASKRFRIDLI